MLSCLTTRSMTSRAEVRGVTCSLRDVPAASPVSYAANTCKSNVPVYVIIVPTSTQSTEDFGEDPYFDQKTNYSWSPFTFKDLKRN